MVRIRFGWLSRLELGLTVLGLTLPSRGSAAGVRGCVVSAAEATEARGRGAERPTRIAELAVDGRFVVFGGQDAWPSRLVAWAGEISSMCHPPGTADVTTRQAGADPAFRWRT